MNKVVMVRKNGDEIPSVMNKVIKPWLLVFKPHGFFVPSQSSFLA
jgi:hypothetical protein